MPRRSKKRTPPGISQNRRHTIDRDGSPHTHEIRALHETDLIKETLLRSSSPNEENGRRACAPVGAIPGPSISYTPCYTLPPSHYFRSEDNCSVPARECHRRKANDGTGQAEHGQISSLLLTASMVLNADLRSQFTCFPCCTAAADLALRLSLPKLFFDGVVDKGARFRAHGWHMDIKNNEQLRDIKHCAIPGNKRESIWERSHLEPGQK